MSSLDSFTLTEYNLPLAPADEEGDASQTPLPTHTASWPVLYVLTDSARKTAYVGETTNYRRRMSQHVANPDKKRFKRSLFIDSPAFNQSATFDFEHRLIELFQVDRRFKTWNRNNGYSQFDYYMRPEYRQMFRALWDALRVHDYACSSLDELENSDLFKFSPFKGLTPDQADAVGRLLAFVDGGSRGDDEKDFDEFDSPEDAAKQAAAVAARRTQRALAIVQGTPGTGKTILAMTLLYALRVRPEYRDLKVALVSPMESLRRTLKKVCSSTTGLRPGDVIGPSDVKKQHYDVLIVDEGHRLHGVEGVMGIPAYRATSTALGLEPDAHQLDWLLAASFKLFFLFDPKQQVRGTGLSKQQLDATMDRLEEEGIPCETFHLSTQMRVKGGDEYLDLAYDMLTNPGRAKHERLGYDSICTPLPYDHTCVTDESERYEFAIIDSFKDFCELQQEKEREASLSRMLAGFAWDWASNPKKEDHADFDISIDGINKRWNSKTEDWVNSPDAVNEVGSIHTVQGYDLNYGFVIIGNDLAYDPEQDRLVASRPDFKDTGAKKLARAEDELFKVVANAYYVLLTRGMRGTYLYVVDPALKDYLSRFVPRIERRGDAFEVVSHP